MLELISLPSELLIHIFAACPTVKSAMHLSIVNKRLQSIWLQHTDQIVQGIIQSTIPAANQAIDFAIIETRLRNSLSDNEQPPLHLWLPNLMRNAELCASAHAACSAYVDPPNSVRKEPMTFPSSPASWYFLRRVLLAFDYPQLRDAVYAELRATPEETREKHFLFYYFIAHHATKDEMLRQGAPLDLRFPPPPGDEWDGDMHQDAWHYMSDILSLARGDITAGRDADDLALTIQGYIT